MSKILVKYWFLLGLALSMSAGFVLSSHLATISSWVWLRRGIVMAVMFLMALPLPVQAIAATLRRPWAAILASLVNLVLLPLVAWLLAGLADPAYVAGFLVIAATPCTLASAAVWTHRAGGNDVTALMTTVLTNLVSFVVSPLIVFLLLRQTPDIEFGDMVTRLLVLVLLPICLAQALASNVRVGSSARQNKKRLAIAAQVGILLMVALGTASSTADLPREEFLRPGSVCRLVALCAALHLLVLAGGYRLAGWLKFAREDQIAVAISGSQKTLMIGLLICLMLQVSLVPMILYHAVQLILDTFIADWFASRSCRLKPVA